MQVIKEKGQRQVLDTHIQHATIYMFFVVLLGFIWLCNAANAGPFRQQQKVLCINPTLFISSICIPCLATQILHQEINNLFHNEFIARIKLKEMNSFSYTNEFILRTYYDIHKILK